MNSLAQADQRSWWSGRLTRRDAPSRPHVVTILERTESGSGVLSAITSEGEHAWIKGIGNAHDDQALVTERMVCGVSEALGLPVAPSQIVDVPASLAGHPLDKFGTHILRAGPAHASLNIEGAQEIDQLVHRDRDHNASRHAGVFAMWDLFLGQDQQWIYQTGEGYSTWSFDHSLWLARGEGDWHEAMLLDLVDSDWSAQEPSVGIDPEALNLTAARLRELSPSDLLATAASVPIEWGSPDSELEALCWFLYRRSRQVAERLEVMSHGLADANEA